MTALNQILATSGVTKAIIIDDSFDQVPHATDLELESDSWKNFFDDLLEEDKKLLREAYPDYDAKRADSLDISNEFVAVLWRLRTELRSELVTPIFGDYESTVQRDRTLLNGLAQQLVEAGLDCKTLGRSFSDEAASADLLIIDLFLGATQSDDAVRRSIDGIKKIVDSRPESPPIVILTSNSPRLGDKSKRFRDEAGLQESAFRIIPKADLSEPTKIERVIMRLARHYKDSLKLSRFLVALSRGIDSARDRTLNALRTLDLSDHAQIYDLLLCAEGQPTGSYLVDVFDRVLQHEIERDSAIIDAADSLNDLDSKNYPPPYIEGSKNLQSIVYKSIFQNSERLRLRGALNSFVAFGDILIRKSLLPDEHQIPAPLNDLEQDSVMAVLTAACDLQRGGSRRVMLLVGKLRPLTMVDWNYNHDQPKTPVIEIGTNRHWIDWNLKHIETVSHSQLDDALAPAGAFEVIARLRESSALELQQKLLTNMGRVGLIAPLPATFPMKVEVYYPNVEKKASKLSIPELESKNGVCYVGRKEIEPRLVIFESVCEAICAALRSLDRAKVHEQARDLHEYLLMGDEMMLALEKGVPLPAPNGMHGIPSPTGALGNNQKIRQIARISRNKDVSTIQGGDLVKAGVLIATWDNLGDENVAGSVESLEDS